MADAREIDEAFRSGRVPNNPAESLYVGMPFKRWKTAIDSYNNDPIFNELPDIAVQFAVSGVAEDSLFRTLTYQRFFVRTGHIAGYVTITVDKQSGEIVRYSR